MTALTQSRHFRSKSATQRRRYRPRRAHLGCVLALLALAIKLLVPPGFMLSPDAAGSWIILCPEGLPPALFDEHHAGHHTDHHSGHHDGRDNGAMASGGDGVVGYCAIGSATAAPALPSEAPQLPPARVEPPTFNAPLLRAPRYVVITARARAPPRALTA